MTVLRYQIHLGFVKEVGWGNSTTVPQVFVPVKNAKFKDEPKFYKDEAFRSVNAQVFGAYLTTLQCNFDFGSDVYIDTFPILAGAGMIGNTDTVSTVYTSSVHAPVVAGVPGSCSAHNFLLGVPSSLSLFDYNGYTERVYQGSRIEDVSLKYAPDGQLEITYKGKSRLSVINASTGNVLGPTIGANPPLLGWEGFLVLNGVQSTRLIDAQIDLKRKTEVLFTQAQTQSPTNIYAFPMEVTGKFTFDFQDETEYNLFRANNQSASFDITFAAQANNAIRFIIPQPVFTTYEVDRGKDFLTAVVDVEGIFSQSQSTNLQMIVYTSTTTPF